MSARRLRPRLLASLFVVMTMMTLLFTYFDLKLIEFAADDAAMRANWNGSNNAFGQRVAALKYKLQGAGPQQSIPQQPPVWHPAVISNRYYDCRSR